MRDIEPTLAPTKAEVAGASATLDNMRLWDPAVLRVWHDGNAAGGELHLLLTGRAADRSVFGAVDLAPVRGDAEGQVVTLEEGLSTVRIAEAMRDSAATGDTVRIPR